MIKITIIVDIFTKIINNFNTVKVIIIVVVIVMMIISSSLQLGFDRCLTTC